MKLQSKIAGCVHRGAWSLLSRSPSVTITSVSELRVTPVLGAAVGH